MNQILATPDLIDPNKNNRLSELETENLRLQRLVGEVDRLRRENEAMRATQRLGLHWEKGGLEEEKLGVELSIIPRLILEENGQPISKLSGNTGNLVIEGDNYDALRLLAKTHAGKIDCIYIDPPYNTGQTTFVYNDRFVGKDYRWRKSLWLDFLHRRLILARDLLSERGVILVSINDEHRSILELLMDEVLPGKRIGSLVWRTRQGKNEAGDGNLSGDHEHILAYGNPGFAFGGKEKTFAMYRFDDHDGRGAYRISDMTVNVPYTDKRAGNGYYPVQDPASGVWYPSNPDAVWRYARNRTGLKRGQKLKARTMEEYISDNKVHFPKGKRVETWSTMDDLLAAIDSGDVPTNGKGVPLLRRDLPDLEFFVGKPVGWGIPQFKRHITDVKSQTQPLSSWVRSTADKGDQADLDLVELISGLGGESDGHLKTIFGEKVFNYAKPPSLMRELLRQATLEDSLVLDFFAGSGTTAEAVLRLNEEDDGSRRFIMISSTEATTKDPNKNLCRDVCARRIRAICEGYGSGKKAVVGTDDGFAYLRIERAESWDADLALEDSQIIWNLLQIKHDRPLTLLDHANVAVDTSSDISIIYCTTGTDAVLEYVRQTVDRPSIVYTGFGPTMKAKLSDLPIETRDHFVIAQKLVNP